MARVYLPFENWPESDRAAWAAAIADGDVLEGRGPAHHWRPATRRTNIEHYSRWLAFMKASITLDSNPAHRVTREAVRSYVAQLQARIAPRTVVSSLVGLKVMIKAMAPNESWRWLEDICNRLNRNSQPSKDKRSRMLDSGELFQKALCYLDRLAKTDLSKRKQLVGYRNGLMVALMTAHPLRLKNFVELSIGTTLRTKGDNWLVKIPGNETKNGTPLEFEVSDRLAPYIQAYLERVRNRLVKPNEAALWVAWEGHQIAYHSAYIAFTRITTELFGRSINPHLFRDCAATTLASHSLKSAMAAPGLLGHLRTETTEKYYVHARQLEASRRINTLLCRLTDKR
jgi:site-specific recombinase XerD